MRRSSKYFAFPFLIALSGVFAQLALVSAEAEAASSPTGPAFVQPVVTRALTAEWWQWAFSVPTSVHALRRDRDTVPGTIDPSSDFCMVGQHGDAWFVGGLFQVVDISTESNAATASSTADVTRTCRIPLGTTILIPVLNAACDTAQEVALGNLDPNAPLANKVSYLRACAAVLGDEIKVAEAFFGPQGGSAEKLTVKRVRANQGFSVTYPPDNIFGVADPKPNPSLSFDDGYWAAVRPATPGTYVLRTYGSAPAFNFTLRIKYILRVVPPQNQ